VAKYNKKRARELKHDKFRDTTMSLFERLGNSLEGKGRTILYAIGAAILLIALGLIFSGWRDRKRQEEAQALGRAIEIANAPVTPSPSPGAATPSFTSDRERAQKAVEEFQKVADKYSGETRESAQYFIATNLLTVDHDKGISQLEALAKSSDQKIATLAKFALAQSRESDAQYDAAAALYTELAKQNSEFGERCDLLVAAFGERL